MGSIPSKIMDIFNIKCINIGISRLFLEIWIRQKRYPKKNVPTRITTENTDKSTINNGIWISEKRELEIRADFVSVEFFLKNHRRMPRKYISSKIGAFIKVEKE